MPLPPEPDPEPLGTVAPEPLLPEPEPLLLPELPVVLPDPVPLPAPMLLAPLLPDPVLLPAGRSRRALPSVTTPVLPLAVGGVPPEGRDDDAPDP